MVVGIAGVSILFAILAEDVMRLSFAGAGLMFVGVWAWTHRKEVFRKGKARE
jgi:hypothetical protein